MVSPVVILADARARETLTCGRRLGEAQGRRCVMNDREQTWQHPWLRIQRLIRSILEVRRDPVTRPVMKATLTDALREREKIRHAGWMH